MTTYRIYGNTGDYGSYAQVTRGFAEAFEAHVERERFEVVSLEEEDSFDQEQHGLPLADVAILTGSPAAAPRLLQGAKHRERLVMVAPNSNKLPMRMMNTVNSVATGLLAPSQWAARVVQDYTELPVVVVPHGVLSGFTCMFTEQELESRYASEEFRILHLSSTSGERKGTVALLHAFAAALSARELPPKATLELVLTPQAMQRVTEEFMDGRVPPSVQKNVVVSGRLGLYGAAPEEMRMRYAAAHVVCQPSRGEAFGLVPLEALVCGTPIVATTCTGHGEWAWLGQGKFVDGLCVVPTHGLTPIDDMPDAVAPELRADELRLALAYAYYDWRVFKHAAMKQAFPLASRWLWREKLDGFIRGLGS